MADIERAKVAAKVAQAAKAELDNTHEKHGSFLAGNSGMEELQVPPFNEANIFDPRHAEANRALLYALKAAVESREDTGTSVEGETVTEEAEAKESEAAAGIVRQLARLNSELSNITSPLGLATPEVYRRMVREYLGSHASGTDEAVASPETTEEEPAEA